MTATRPFRVLFGVVLLLSWIGFNVAAGAQTCTPPDEMKAKLGDKPTAAVLNDLGVWFASHEQYACAANAFGSSLQADAAQPDLPHVVFEFGASLYLSGDTKEAIPSLQEAEKLGYRDGKIHVILATALDSTHAGAEAEAEWRKALEFDPDNAAALDALSSDLLADGDYKGVIELLERPRLAAWRSAQQTINLGAAYVKTAKPEDAVRVLQDGLNTNPDSFEVAQQLASVLVDLNRKDEAAMVLQLAQARKQQNATQAGK
jgi:Flp pilus assembly protein TadD